MKYSGYMVCLPSQVAAQPQPVVSAQLPNQPMVYQHRSVAHVTPGSVTPTPGYFTSATGYVVPSSSAVAPHLHQHPQPNIHAAHTVPVSGTTKPGIFASATDNSTPASTAVVPLLPQQQQESQCSSMQLNEPSSLPPSYSRDDVCLLDAI